MAKGTKIRGITIELNADTAGILDSLKELNSSLSTTNRALTDVNKLLKLDPENVTLLGQKQEYLTKAIEDTSKKLEEEKNLLAQLQSADNASETTEQQKALAREIESTSQRLNKYQSELAETKNKLDGVKDSSGESSKNIKSTADAVEALAKSQAFSVIATGAKELSAALLECVHSAESFETSMAKVATLAGSDATQMAEEIKTAAVSLGVSSSDLAEAVYQAMSAGVSSADAVEFAANATKLAIGGFTEAATAVDIVTTAINAYGMSVEDTTHIMDALVATQNLGKTTVNELATQMGRVIPTASAYGVSLDQLSAAYAELTAKGVSTRIATTDLNALFNELGDTSSAVSEILIEKTGYSFSQLMGQGKSLGQVLGILYDSVGRDSAAFQGLWSQSSAATAAFNMASDGGQRFDDILNQMITSSGLAESNFQMMAETAEMTGKRFETATENLKIAIGDALAPTIDSLKEVGIEALEPITEFIERNPALVTAITGMIAGIVGVTTAIAAATAAVTLFKVAMGDVKTLAIVLGSAAGLGAVAGGLLGVASEANNAARELKSAANSLKDTYESTEANAETNRISIERAKELAARWKELATQAGITEEALNEQNQIATELNSTIPGLGLSLRNTTGYWEESTQAVLDNVDALIREAEISAIQGELTELIRERNEAQRELKDTTDELTDAQERYDAWMERTNGRDTIMGVTVAEIGILRENIEDLTEAQETAQTVYDAADARITELTATVTDYTLATQEETEAANAAAEAAEVVSAAQEKLQQEYEKTKQTAIDSLETQRQKFLEYKNDASQSVDEMITDLQTQAQNMQDYADLIVQSYQIMTTRTDAQGLLSYYIEQGPAAAGELQNLVDAFNGDADAVKNFNDAVQAFNDTEDLIETLGTYQAALETGFTEPLDNAVALMEITLPEIEGTLSDSYEAQQEDAEEHHDNMIETTEGTIVDMATAVEDNTPYVVEAVANMNQAMIAKTYEVLQMPEGGGQSTVFYNVGYQIDESLAAGINAGTSIVCDAIKDMCERAVASVDISGLTDRIDSALGSAIGG